MSSWPSATGRSSSRSSRTGRCSGPVCGSETNPSPARPGEVGQPDHRRRRVRGRARGHGRRRRGPQAVVDHRLGQHRGGPQRRISRIVDEHRDSRTGGRGEAARPRNVLGGVARRCARSTGFRRPRRPRAGSPPRTARRPRGRGAGRPAGRPRPGGRRGRGTPPDRQHRRHPLQAGRGVDVDERLHVQHAVEHRLVEGAPYVRDDPRTVVVLLDAEASRTMERIASPMPSRCTTRAPRRRPSATCRPCRGAGGR